MMVGQILEDRPGLSTLSQTSAQQRALRTSPPGPDLGTAPLPVSIPDPVAPVISALLSIVPASRWVFARVRAETDVEDLLASEYLGGELAWLRAELRLQRERLALGPRVSFTASPIGQFAHGLTLIFADDSTTFGIICLLRMGGYGPFSASEISMASLALSSGSEELAALRLQPGSHDIANRMFALKSEPDLQANDNLFYVLDRDYEIKLAWNSDDRPRISVEGRRKQINNHLPKFLEDTVRAMTADWSAGSGPKPARVARPVPFLIVHTHPMTGMDGQFIGVRIERFCQPNSLVAASRRFHITPRETQVLALLLAGQSLEEIGHYLHISASTVQDHVRSLVTKTGSRNRAELIARVLGWATADETSENLI